MLATLLSENYDRLTSPECKIKTLEYLSANAGVLHEDLVFVKHLTKVIHHILESSPGELDAFTERIFRYNEEGIQLAREKGGHLSQNNLKSMESHFHAYAADAAIILYETSMTI